MARVEVRSEVAGTVWKRPASVGDVVSAGDALVILESMKMEVPVEASAAGTVIELPLDEGDGVDEEQIVAVLETA